MNVSRGMMSLMTNLTNLQVPELSLVGVCCNMQWSNIFLQTLIYYLGTLGRLSVVQGCLPWKNDSLGILGGSGGGGGDLLCFSVSLYRTDLSLASRSVSSILEFSPNSSDNCGSLFSVMKTLKLFTLEIAKYLHTLSIIPVKTSEENEYGSQYSCDTSDYQSYLT